LEQLFKRLVFNILCNNSDDHLRNHGFLHHAGQGWRLSPAFDIVPQPDMGPAVPRRLTLGVGMDGSRDATLKNALSSSGVFGLSRERGRGIIAHMTKLFLSRWESIYTKNNVPEKDMATVSEAFVNHLR
jgi:serine/threonine-protein kinase HipA